MHALVCCSKPLTVSNFCSCTHTNIEASLPDFPSLNHYHDLPSLPDSALSALLGTPPKANRSPSNFGASQEQPQQQQQQQQQQQPPKQQQPLEQQQQSPTTSSPTAQTPPLSDNVQVSPFLLADPMHESLAHPSTSDQTSHQRPTPPLTPSRKPHPPATTLGGRAPPSRQLPPLPLGGSFSSGSSSSNRLPHSPLSPPTTLHSRYSAACMDLQEWLPHALSDLSTAASGTSSSRGAECPPSPFAAASREP